MPRKHIATSALLAAALPAFAFHVGVTADYLKAKINDYPVAATIVHSRTDGEGYTGEVMPTCNGVERRPVGYRPAMYKGELVHGKNEEGFSRTAYCIRFLLRFFSRNAF